MLFFVFHIFGMFLDFWMDVGWIYGEMEMHNILTNKMKKNKINK